jgi:hypothetical protein
MWDTGQIQVTITVTSMPLFAQDCNDNAVILLNRPQQVFVFLIVLVLRAQTLHQKYKAYIAHGKQLASNKKLGNSDEFFLSACQVLSLMLGQAGLHLHTFPEVAFRLDKWTMQGYPCVLDKTPNRHLDIHVGPPLSLP